MKYFTFALALVSCALALEAPYLVCITPECTIAAASLIEAMNPKADPCQDFFEFACGGWVAKHPIPSTKSRFTQFDILEDQLTNIIRQILQQAVQPSDAKPIQSAKRMYAACMDTKSIEARGLKPLSTLVDSFGGWPMAQEKWSGPFDWKSMTSTLRSTYGSAFFVNVYNNLDSMNTNKSSIYVDQGSLALPRSILVNLEDNKEIIQAYSTYIQSVAKAFVKGSVTDKQIADDADAMIHFESALAKITTPSEDRRNNTRMYNPMTIKQLQELTDSVVPVLPQAQIDWLKYISDTYKVAGIPVTQDDRVIVVEPEYLQKLVLLLNGAPPRIVANYIQWRMVMDLSDETTQYMNDLAFNFAKVLYGTSEPEPRWITCGNKVNDLLGYAVGSKYIEVAFSDEAKVEVEAMIANLKIAFESLVDDAQWMDDQTKAIARHKAEVIREFVAYPDWILDKDQLEAYYKGLAEMSAVEHFCNVGQATSFTVIKDFSTLPEDTDRTKWIAPPTIVNAFYEPTYNSITFPAGILQSPFFAHGRISSMNYGAIGVVIGHEITHGFDDEGRQSDENGNTVQWWTDATLSNYLTRAQCFIDQYSNYTIPSGTHLNGFNTQGENIADNGGLREAFRAYKLSQVGPDERLPGLQQYTPEQIFFLAYANMWCGVATPEGLENQILTDPHSPSRFRVIVPLSNSDDFAEQFQCPVGSPMNPGNKCILW